MEDLNFEIEINTSCLRTVKGNELQKLNSLAVDGDFEFEDEKGNLHPILLRRIKIAEELLEKLKRNNPDWTFDVDYDEFAFTAKLKYLCCDTVTITADGYYKYENYFNFLETLRAKGFNF